MTPSEQAKKFAAENGYNLISNYSIRRIMVVKGDRKIGEYAKYEGALRAMQADVSASGVVEAALFPETLAPRDWRIKQIAADTKPCWRVWWKSPHGSGYSFHHNYADAVKYIRQVFSDAALHRVAIASGVKYFISRVPG